MRSASRDHGRIIRGSFVELRGRPWLVEESRGEGSELQTLCLSCISDDAQGERLEVPWDAEIGAKLLGEDELRPALSAGGGRYGQAVSR